MIHGSKRSARGAQGSRRLGAAIGAWGLGAALLVAGCGSDGGTDNPDPTGDGNPPAVHVAFPPPLSLTDATTITLRGTASDADGVAAIRVNGVDARLTDGGTAWEATVSLQHGDNVLVIESEDSFGAVDAQAARVTVVLSANWLVTPQAVVADVTNNRALVLDPVLDALLAVDLDTGERTVLSDDELGTGPRLRQPIALALDADNGRALVLDTTLSALLAVDLATGDRTVIADATTGEGPALVTPVALALDADNGRALVLDVDRTDPASPVSTLHAVDLATGDRAVIADAETGEGPALVAPVAVVLDADNDRALVLDVDATIPAEEQIILYAVDLSTGDRTLVSDDAAEGPRLISPRSMVLDDTREGEAPRALVLDDELDGLIAVDLDTGARTAVSVDGTAAGVQLGVPTSVSLAIGTQGTRALVVDSALDALVAIDLDTGARTMVSNVALGEGPVLGNPTAVLLDSKSGSHGRAVVLDAERAACIAVDIATATRVAVSSNNTGSGPRLDEPWAVSLDVPVGPEGQTMAANRVIVADQDLNALLYVNLATGDRSVLSDAGKGSGPAFDEIMALAIQPADEQAGRPYRALVLDAGLDALLAVDLSTGDRTVIADDDIGTGPRFAEPRALAIEVDDETGMGTGRALVLDHGARALLAVDLDTGNRTVIADASTGNGPALDKPVALVQETRRTAVENQATGESVQLYLSTGRVLVVDEGLGAVLAVSLSSGTRNELSGPSFGRGPALARPQALALDADHQRVLLADRDMDALLMVDLVTGERVVLTR